MTGNTRPAVPGTLDLKDLGTVRRRGFATLRGLQDEGQETALGLSQVTVEQLAAAHQHCTVATVQSRFDRTSQGVLDRAARVGFDAAAYEDLIAAA